ncbi:hypothetical protein GCM10009677_18400 [Sphaerisporangium rubeum]
MPLPDPIKVEIMNVDLTDLEPVPRWVDTLLKLQYEDGQVIAAIESQTARSEQKRRRWARYLAHLHDTYECDVLLIVTCATADTASWARSPYDIGPGRWPTMTLRPLVLGPDNMPPVTTEAEAAQDIHYAILSAVVHAKSPNVDVILDALSDALGHLDRKEAAGLAEFTESGLGAGPARNLWRTLMATKTHTYISEMRAKGRVEGCAESVLVVLEGRGLTVTDAERERIIGCTDTDQLRQWLLRAVTAASVDELLA